MQLNVASQKLIVFAFDSTTNLPKTGDAANLTAYVSKNYGAVTVLGDTSATEMDATNAKGYYLFDLTQAETNADTLLFSAKSSTANIVVIGVPAVVFTTAANFNLTVIDGSGRLDVSKISGTSQTARDLGASVLLSPGTGTGQLSITSGVVDGNTTKWNGTAVATPDTAGYVKVTIKAGTGTGEINLASGAVPTKGNVKKNAALATFPFMMTDSTNHNPATGKTVTCTRSIDGGAFAAGTLANVAEVGNGIYTVDFGAGDLNGNCIILRATAAACDDTDERIITEVA